MRNPIRNSFRAALAVFVTTVALSASAGRYWLGKTADAFFGETGNWATSSGGSPDASVPAPESDCGTVYFRNLLNGLCVFDASYPLDTAVRIDTLSADPFVWRATAEANGIVSTSADGLRICEDGAKSPASLKIESGAYEFPYLRIGCADNAVAGLELAGGSLTAAKVRVANKTGATGTLQVTGGTLTATDSFLVSDIANTTAEVVVDGGTLDTTAVDYVRIGRSNNASATVRLESGTWNTKSFLVGGDAKKTANDYANVTAKLIVNGGTLNASGDCSVGANAGENAVSEMIVNGGAVNFGTGYFYLGDGAPGTFTLNGGTVTMQNSDNGGFSFGHLSGASEAGTLVLNGGTLVTARLRLDYVKPGSSVVCNGGTLKATRSTSSFINASDNLTVTLGKGGLVIDTDGYDVTIAHPLTGEGGIVKKGAGKLTLTGANDFTGAIKVYAGSVVADGQTYVAPEGRIDLDGSAGGDLGEVTLLGEKMGGWAADPAIFNYGSTYGVGGVATEELPKVVEVRLADGTTKSYRNLEIGATVQYGGDGDVFTTKALAPRTLEVAGHDGKLVKNVRDCGGWPLIGGGRSNQGLVFRGGHLDEFTNATAAEKADNALVTLGLKTEIELRKDGVDLPSQYKTDDVIRTTSFVNDGVAYVYCGIGWGNDGGSQIGADDNGNFTNQIHKVFSTLGTPGRLPAYFHCRIGTDRTGIVGLLLQALCGATEETLYRDYLASNFANIESSRSPEVPETFLRYLYRGHCYDGKYVYSENTYGESAAARARAYLEMCGVTDAELSAITEAMTGETLDGVLARVNAYETAHGVRTVSFKEKEGASAIAMHRVAAGETPVEPLTAPTKEGYAFKGWDYANEAADGSVYPIWEQTEGPGRDKLSFRWDNDTGTSRIADDGNWYVHETNPKERDEVTIIDSAESDGTFQYLDEGDVFEVKDVIFGRNSSNPSVVDISNGTMRVANLLTLGRYGQSTVFNVFGGSVEAKALAVGNWGSHNRNTMTISGGEVLVRGGNWPGALTLGLQTESRGNLTISGGTLTACNTVNVGFANIRKFGSPEEFNNSITVEGGVFSVTGNVEVANSDGHGDGSAGLVAVKGGLMDVQGELNIAVSTNAWGEVDVSGGNLTVSGNIRVGNHAQAVHAALNITGGEVDCGELSVARQCSADLIVKDATVRAKIINKSQSAPAEAVPTAYLDNATIVAKQGYDYNFSSFEKVEVGAGGLVYDTDGHDVKIQAFRAMTGVGGLTKDGEGKLEIVANSFGFPGDFKLRGDIVVNAGTLKLPKGQTFYVTDTRVAEGATLDLNGSTVVLVDKKLVRSIWTNATGDGDATNGANWETVVSFSERETGTDLPELTETLNVVPGAETTVRLPYELPRPTNLDPETVGSVTVVATDVDGLSLVIDYGATYDSYGSVGSLTAAGTRVKIANSLNGLLKSAVGWYDPSEASTRKVNEDGTVNGLANKGTLGTALDFEPMGGTTDKTMPVTGKPDEWLLDGILFETVNRGFKTPYASALAGDKTFVGVDRHIDGEWYPFLANADGTFSWIGAAELWGSKFRYFVSADWGETLNPSGAPGTENKDTIRSFRVASKALSAEIYYGADGKTYGAATDVVEGLISDPMRLCMGERSWWNGNAQHGYVGESLAFDNALSDGAVAAVRDYLAVKWLGAEPQVTLSPTVLADLALEGATVDFDDADVSVGRLGGWGAVENASGLTVTGGFSLGLTDEGSVPTIVATKVPVTVSETATLAATEALVDYVVEHGRVVVLEAESVALPRKLLYTDAKNRVYQLRKDGSNLVFERRPSFSIHVR